jgi:F-type H+-transporting ATPase subunit b
MLGLLALIQGAEGHAGPASPFEVNFGLFFWTWVVFFALLYVLKRFAWPPLVKATEDREKRLQALLDDAERKQAEAAKLMAQNERLLAETRASAHNLLQEARTAAEKERALAIEKTRQEQEELLERARRDILAERDRAVAELRREAVDLSLAAASKLIGEELDSEKDRRIVQEYLNSVGSRH